MKKVIILLAALALGGCSRDRAKDMAACQVEAERFYQTYRAVNSDDPSSQYIIGCMAAKGYDFTISPAACNSEHPLPTQPACYAARSWPDWVIDQFRSR
jgi:hypothetical protein